MNDLAWSLGTASLTITEKYEEITSSNRITSGRTIVWQQGFFDKGNLGELPAKRRAERKESKIQNSKLKQFGVTSKSVARRRPTLT
ncbi:hypothetical protein PtB15_15B211 [Puccinia triticina]|nr:hypothetical protein PtB15_15B211 [Puccinia triticina]